MIEASDERDYLHSHLDELSEFCDHGTKVVVVGRANDIALYRAKTAGGSRWSAFDDDLRKATEARNSLALLLAGPPQSAKLEELAGKPEG